MTYCAECGQDFHPLGIMSHRAMHKRKRNKFVNGVAINPELPRGFSSTRNEDRPASHQKWWNRPYIEIYDWERMSSGAPGPPNASDEERAAWFEEWRQQWLKAWPSGVRYDVRCLDGGAWDRPTCWGMFKTLDEALLCAKSESPWAGLPEGGCTTY